MKDLENDVITALTDSDSLHHSVIVTDTSNDIDEILVRRLQSGDETALTELFHLEVRFIKSIVLRIIYNDADADDVVNAIFQEAWTMMKNYDSAKGKFKGWLVTLARRRAIDQGRKNQARGRMHDHFEVIREKPNVRGDIMHQSDRQNDRHERLRELIYSIHIPDEQRECLVLHWLGEMSQRDIAAHLGISLGTIKTRLALGFLKITELVANDPTFV